MCKDFKYSCVHYSQAGNLSTLAINYRTEGLETMLHGTSNASMWLANNIQTKNNSLKELTKKYLS